jgi:hypothetical protein
MRMRYFDQGAQTHGRLDEPERAASLRGSLRIISRSYSCFAISCGAISLFFSIAALLTSVGLPFRFGYAKGHVSLLVGDALFNAVIWSIVLIGFLSYPVIMREARSSYPVLLTHGAIFILLAWTALGHEESLILAIANIAGYLIALRGSSRLLGVRRMRMITISLTTLLGFVVLVEVLAFFAWSTDPLAALKAYSSGTTVLSAAGRLDFSFFYLAYGLTVWLIAVLMVSSLLEPVHRRIRLGASIASPLSREPAQLKSAFLAGGLVLTLVLSALVAYLPYTFSKYPIGIDANWYYEVLNALGRSITLPQLLAGEGAVRGAILVLFYAIRLTTHLPARDSVMTGAIMISVFSALGSFLLMRETGQGDGPSLLAALFAGASPQMLVGTLASIFGNWLAVSEMFFFFASFLRAAKTKSKASLSLTFAISLMILVTHPWTWPILVLILAIYVTISALRDRSWGLLLRSAGLRLLAASILVVLIIFVIASRSEALGGTMRLGYSWAFLENLRAWRTPAQFLSDMQIALFNYSTQGLYSNWLMISLAIVGVFGLAKAEKEKETRAVFGAWILGPSVLVLLLSPEIQWRLLFLIPYHILAAMGVVALTGGLGRLVRNRSQSPLDSRMVTAVQALFIAFLVLLFFNSALRSMVFIPTQVSI